MWKHVEKTVDVLGTGNVIFEVHQKKNVEHILTQGSAVSAAMRLKLRPVRFKVPDVEFESEYDEWRATKNSLPCGNHGLKDWWFWGGAKWKVPLTFISILGLLMIYWNPTTISPFRVVWLELIAVLGALTSLFAVVGYRRYAVIRLNQREKLTRDAHFENEPVRPDNPTTSGLMMEVKCEKKINPDWMSMSQVLELDNRRNRNRSHDQNQSSLIMLITGLIEADYHYRSKRKVVYSDPITILERKYVLEINQFIEDPNKWDTLVVNTRETLTSIMRESLAEICAEPSTKDDVAARITSKITDELFGGLPDLLEKKRKEREVLSVERRLSGL